ncbi:MAG: DUF547 domain-containing protein [Myxococcota bacterium]
MRYRTLGPWILVWLVLSAVPAAAVPFDTALYAQILARHTEAVSDTAGVRVDYRGLRSSPEWRQLLDNLARTEPHALSSREEKLAFWVNTYNVLAIALVVDHYPVNSIRDIGSLLRPVWKRNAGVVGGRAVTLDWIEHGVLRSLGEPRIHAAIVCASVSCPSLLREPWRADALDAQFDTALKSWLANREKGLRIDRSGGTLTLSPIFEWFEEDFAGGGGVLASIAPYLTARDRSWLAQHPSPTRRSFDYDWHLNDLVDARQGDDERGS